MSSQSRDEASPPRLSKQLESFFFSQDVPYGLAMTRILLCGTLLWTLVWRFPYARELYSTDGAIAQLSITFGQGNLLPELPGTAVIALFSLLMCALFGGMVGWQTRICLFLSCILYTYFCLLDALSTLTKYSVISSHLLLLLSLSECGSLWSVDSWLSSNTKRGLWPGQPTWIRPKSSVWPQRLMQLFIGLIYLGAAATKLHTPSYFNGDQLKYWMLTQLNHGHPVGDYLSMHPALVVIMCYIAVIWEIGFIFTAFTRWGRISMLSLGVIFHIATTLTLGLFIFPLVMIASYCSFITSSDIQWASQHARYLRRRFLRGISGFDLSIPRLTSWRPVMAHYSLLMFVSAIVLATSAGVQAENWMDPYDVHRAEGPHTLNPMPMERVAELFQQENTMREVDRIFSFRLGSIQLSDIVVDARHEFTQGERLVAQVSLTPPHGDMYLECLLLDADGDLLHQEYYIAPRESNLVHFYYNLCESLVPGNYTMVLRANAKEVQRQPFVLKPGVCTVPQPTAQ